MAGGDNMPREKEDFREILQNLRDRFPGREAVFLKEAAEILGVSYRVLVNNKNFPKKKIGGGKTSQYVVSLVGFARWMS